MDVADLKVFEAVARHGSMNKAATELHTVQSNVTARIRSLEREVGIALFNRNVRGVSLTPAGHRMLPYAARLAKLVAEAKLAAMDEGSPNGTLALGTLETTAALRLSPFLSQFARRYSQVRLSLTTGTSCSLTADVAECRLDGAFVEETDATAHRLYVGNVYSHNISVIDTGTQQVIGSFNVPDDVVDLVVDPAAHRLYALYGQLGSTSQSVAVLDTTTGATLHTFSYDGLTTIALDAADHRLYGAALQVASQVARELGCRRISPAGCAIERL